MPIGAVNYRHHLNGISRGSAEAKLGDIIYDLIGAVNDLQVQNKALLAKLDAANLAGMASNNVATLSPNLPAVRLPEQR